MNKSWMAVANQYYVVYYGVPEMKIKAFRVFRDVGMKKATDVETEDRPPFLNEK